MLIFNLNNIKSNYSADPTYLHEVSLSIGKNRLLQQICIVFVLPKRHMLLKMLSYVSFSENLRTSPKKLTYDNDGLVLFLLSKNQPYVAAVTNGCC